MKKIILAFTLFLSLSAQASLLNFFDFSKFFEAALVIGEGIAVNLEKVRIESQKNLNIREQWDQACEVSQTLNPSLLALNKLLVKHKVNSELCAPVTTVIKLQTDIIARCQDFYSKPVPENAEFLLSKFTLSLIQTRLLMNKCYPELAKIKIPGLPGGN